MTSGSGDGTGSRPCTERRTELKKVEDKLAVEGGEVTSSKRRGRPVVERPTAKGKL